MMSAHFGDLNAQSFISENQAVLKLMTKVDQLSKIPNVTLTFPSGKKVVGDAKNPDRVQYYSMILQSLQAKPANGSASATTKSAYEAAKAVWNQKRLANLGNTPDEAIEGNLSWLDNEVLQYLTH
jgi:uncharacterized protein YlzI (FlbEa/FlbD family)